MNAEIEGRGDQGWAVPEWRRQAELSQARADAMRRRPRDRGYKPWEAAVVAIAVMLFFYGTIIAAAFIANGGKLR